MYQRSLLSTIERLKNLYPVIGIMGPRQSGKTTLAKIAFPDYPYISLENLDTRLEAQNDPRGFLAKYEGGVIFDEIQNAPDLLSYIQGIVDASDHKGRYIVTGSQNFSLSTQITQSLAGRIGICTLLPLSLNELHHQNAPYEAIFYGGYPGLHKLNIDPADFYPNYIQSYIERDVRALKNIENIGTFQTFVKLCAGRAGQILNLSSLAHDCGISHTTARSWLNILEASYIIFPLQPFYKNFNKRLIKMPKLYFYDTGLVCNLLGLEQSSQLDTHYLKGALYENLVILEIMKHRFNNGRIPNIYFWRDTIGREIDVIADWGGNTYAIEIKFSSTYNNDYTKNINYFAKLDPTSKGYVVSNSHQESIINGVSLVNLNHLTKLLQEQS